MNYVNEEIKFCIDTGRWNSFGKVGGTESAHIMHYLQTNCPKLVRGDELHRASGIYTETPEELKSWCDLYIDSIKSLDYVLEWCPEQGDKYILDKIWKGKHRFYSFDDLEPFIHLEEGWHYSLSNKKVLVLSPFEKTIYKQVENYSKIWNGAEIGDVQVIKTPSSSVLTGKEPVKFMEIYDDLSNKIKNSDFDFAIVGVGGFSLPLLKIIKEMKKPSIHLGGAVQIVFGICGNRWDNNEKFINSSWYNKNSYWTRPLLEETPTNHKLNENGCYW